MEPKDMEKALESATAGIGLIGEGVKALAARVEAVEKAGKSRITDVESRKKGSDLSVVRFAKAALTKNLEHLSDAEKAVCKTLTSDTDSLGGYTVPVEQMTEWVEFLRANTVVREAGARVISGLSGSPVTFPKQTGAATASFIGQGTAISGTDQALGQISMTPKQASAMTKIQRRLMNLSNPSIEAMVREDLAAQIARRIDLSALVGLGGANEPLGVRNTPGISTFAPTGAGNNIAAEDFYTAIQKLESANAFGGSMAFIMDPLNLSKTRKLRSDSGAGAGTGDFLLQPMDRQLAGAAAGTILGFPVYSTTQLPFVTGTRKDIYFGNWNDLLIGEWGGLDILASAEAGDANGSAFTQNQVWIRAIQEVDVAVRHGESFAVITAVETV